MLIDTIDRTVIGTVTLLGVIAGMLSYVTGSPTLLIAWGYCVAALMVVALVHVVLGALRK